MGYVIEQWLSDTKRWQYIADVQDWTDALQALGSFERNHPFTTWRLRESSEEN